MISRANGTHSAENPYLQYFRQGTCAQNLHRTVESKYRGTKTANLQRDGWIGWMGVLEKMKHKGVTSILKVFDNIGDKENAN